jgi:UDP-N-acetylglucosamine 4,6-dehydratase
LQTALVTGGTGSLGQTIVNQLLSKYTVRILSRNEYFQWEMKKNLNNNSIRYFIGDIRDKERLWRAFQNVDLIIHAAALKHVSFCEYNPIEAVRTNIEGSINVIEIALDRNVEKVLAISSDKAVNPINIYGATKLCMEKLFLDANVYGGKFSIVRSGNFYGSRGSVIPLWKEQSKSGRITVTDKDMSRYFVNLSDMASFVLRCAETMQGKEIFVPDMKLENIDSMTTQMFPGVEKEYTGRQEGEKLFEDIMTKDEKLKALKIEGGYVVRT